MIEPGSDFAGYRVIAPLGEGGMGIVYLVEHPHLGRREALKVIGIRAGDAEFGERFAREARAAAALRHPGIVTVHNFGLESGTPWYTMDFLDGNDLSGAGPLPPADVSRVVTAVADALDHAHGNGVVHRDVKPANIIVSRDGSGAITDVVMVDFGIARLVTDGSQLTATNAFVGSMPYAAAEIFRGEPAGPAADQYSLACTAAQLLTGTQPFRGMSFFDYLNAHTRGAPVLPGASDPRLAALDPVFARALDKNPAARYPTCAAFAADLATRLRDLDAPRPSDLGAPRPGPGPGTGVLPPLEGFPATVAASAPRPAPHAARVILPAAGAAIVVIALVVGAIVWSGSKNDNAGADEAAGAPSVAVSQPNRPSGEDTSSPESSAAVSSGSAPSQPSAAPASGTPLCVYNASATAGLGGTTAQLLRAAGFTVSMTSNLASGAITENTVFYRGSAQRADAERVVDALGGKAEIVERPSGFTQCADGLPVIMYAAV